MTTSKKFGARLAAIGAVALLIAAASACGKKKDGDGSGGSAPAGSGGAGAPASDRVIKISGIPNESPTEMQRHSEPVVKYLEKRLGAKVEYVPVTDYGAAVQALSAGKLDIAWLGGFTYVQARNLAGAVPLVQRDVDREFKSIFITSDPSITKPADLKGKTFAFGSKSSTSGHLMPRYFLTTQFKIDPDKDFDGAPAFSGAHDATAKMVESGKVKAGVLDMQVWDRLQKENKIDPSKVKAFYTTDPFMDYTWVARKDLDQATKDAFIKAFTDLDPSKPEDAEVLKTWGSGANKYVPTNASDYDKLEGIAKSTGLLTTAGK